MATAKNYYIREPSPRQSPFVYMALPYLDANAITPYVRIGWLGARGSGINRVPKYAKLLTFSCSLACSAVVANRTITVTIGKYPPNESLAYLQVVSLVTGNIAANQSGRVTLSPIGALTNLTMTDTVTLSGHGELPETGVIMAADDFISVTIANAQAGDQLNVAAEFEYLNHKLGITES